MSIINPEDKKYFRIPVLMSFREVPQIEPGGGFKTHAEFELLFYRGGGRSKRVQLKDPPAGVTLALLACLEESQRFLDELKPPPRMTHRCPGVLDQGEKCGGEQFIVTVDKLQSGGGAIILRLDCPKCGNAILQDLEPMEKLEDEPKPV